MICLEKVYLPAFGRAAHCPALPVEVFRRRLDAATARLDASAFDVLAVYADREHCANMAYLTGFDPRFEEALLLLDRHGNRLLMVGNENMGYLPDADLGFRVELFQEFSLLGQSREQSRPLRDVFGEFGIGSGARVGCAGWKSYQSRFVLPGAVPAGDAPTALDLPAYIVDVLRELCGDVSRVTNAAGMFTNLDDGLRVVNEPEQIARFEFAASVASDGVLEVLRHIRPGAAEDELERLMDGRGLPLSCHRMIGFGEKAQRGLASPSERRASLGDQFTTAFGVAGSLCARAGCVASGPDDLSDELRDFYPRFAANYFSVVAAWYGALRVGATAGDVFQAAESRRNPRLLDFALNPGHYLHLDEWLNSPFTTGSRSVLKSGSAVQADIIPVSRGPFCCSNVEDGVVLADESLRERLSRAYPDAWERISHRRSFMQEALGIRLDASVLPLGNTPGWLPPYVLSLEQAFVERP